ncbi:MULTISPECIES: acetyl-CoA carboxylase biotin carboxyl carrier protein [unclassified Microbacterium]|uniref:acetyl-CoA carboxylase biotin carboxyl carrier protein n=1 Tax=unclassified Microbacterium TaxID=2609290 RepID=UPI000C2CA3EB|nr:MULTISPECIES: acetyl-CoA carboxylase biotin carboxyl carrier protein [unclassified Microbacterium]
MPLNPPDIKELKAIIDWVNLSEDVRELTLKYGDVELFITRNEGTRGPAAAPVPTPAPVAQPVPAPPAPAALPAAAASAPEPPAAANTGGSSGDVSLAADEVLVRAPMVGTYYAAPKPGAPAFVEVGGRVEAGAVLCIVEVMKLMNNIEAPAAGVVTQILVENNQTVEYGQPMLVIRRDA